MNKISNIEDKKRELFNFITNRCIKEFRVKIDARKYILLKIKLTDNVDQVFCCYHYCTNNKKIDEYDKFETAGYISNGILYGGYTLSLIFGPLEIPKWNHEFSELMLEEKIQNYIEDYIDNNLNQFRTDMQHEYYERDWAEKMSEEWIVNHGYVTPPKYTYKPNFELDTEDYVLYLDKGDNYISEKGNEVIHLRQRGISLNLLGYESAVKMFNAKKNNPDLIHIANMKKSLEELNAKTVKVKVCKEGISITIQIDTDTIKNCYSKNSISIWYSPKPDRDLFDKTYGRSAYLYPEDIEEIYFRNKLVYKKGE